MAKQFPRGVRNNNPLNVKFSTANHWYGQTGADEDGFVICEYPWQGYRMSAVLLKNYQKNHLATDGSAIDTVAEIIARWAPQVPSGTENPHQAAYIATVRRWMGVEKGAHIDCEDHDQMKSLISAMARFETGMEKPFGALTDKALERGLLEAGIRPEGAPAAKDKDLKATKVVTVTGGAGIVAASAAPAALPLSFAELGGIWPFATRLIEIAPWVIAIGLVGGAGYVGYRLWRKHQYGV